MTPNMQIDYTFFLAYKRLSKRFTIETMERHWKVIVAILDRRRF